MSDTDSPFWGQVRDALGIEPEDRLRLSGGASRETWSFTAGGRSLIVQARRSSKGVSGHPPAVEAALLAAAAEAGVPVPGLVAQGDTWFVVERVEGETIARKLLRDEAFAAARAVLPEQCGRALAAIHSIPVDAISGLDDHDQLDLYATLIAGLDHPRPALALGLRRLQGTRPAGGRPALVHGDFRTGNLLVGPDGLRAVLDWELAHVGDPIEDLGWFCSRAWRFGSPHRAGGFGPVEDLLRGYGTPVDPAALQWWEAFAALKWAVICLFQASTHLSGASRSVELAAIGRRATESEWDLLCALGISPQEDPVLGAAPRTSFVHPTAKELVEAVREHLAEVTATTEGRPSFQARVARNALGIVERELELGPAITAAHQARLEKLGLEDDAALVAAIQAGRDDLGPSVATMVRDQLLVANPRYLNT